MILLTKSVVGSENLGYYKLDCYGTTEEKYFNSAHCNCLNDSLTQITEPGCANIFRRIFRLSQLQIFIQSIHNQSQWSEQWRKVANFKIACFR